MKFGANTFIWVSPFTSKDIDIIYKVKDLGFDEVEIALEDLSLIDLKKIKKALDSTGLECTMCGAFGPTRDLISQDPSIRENAKKYITDCISACSELRSHLFAGPVYSAVGKTRLIKEEQKRKEWNLCVESLRGLSHFAQKRGVVIAVEPLNRFETDFINLAHDAVRLMEEVNSSSLKVLLDTFHMNIEEKSLGQAIRNAGRYLYHFHASENDRGTPGSGHIPWQEVAAAIKDIGYDRYMVIESFTPGVKEIAKAASIWRKLEVDQDTLAREGLTFLKNLFR
ncbi:MAG: sugar phosphate isomerase/epimerase family protein [bacterium]